MLRYTWNMASRADLSEIPEHDDVLMLAVQKGEVGRLGTLFDRYHWPLFNFFLRMTGERNSSEDLVQEVFLRILKYRATYQPQKPFKAWMYSIGRHLLGKRSSPSGEVSFTPQAHDTASPHPGPAEVLQLAEDGALLRAAIRQLPPDKREALILSRFQGLKYEEVAVVTDCSVGTVKVRVHRAVQELRDILTKLAPRSSS